MQQKFTIAAVTLKVFFSNDAFLECVINQGLYY